MGNLYGKRNRDNPHLTLSHRWTGGKKMENFEARFERLEEDNHQIKIDLALFSGQAMAFATKADLELLGAEQAVFHVEMVQRYTLLEEKVQQFSIRFDDVDGRLVSIEGKLSAIDGILFNFANKFNAIEVSFNIINAKFDDVYKEFAANEVRFNGIDARLDAMDIRFDGIDKRLDGIDMRLNGIDIRLDGIDRRLDAMDRRMEAMDQRFDRIDERFDKLDLRFESLNNRLIWTLMVPAILAVFAWFINTAVLNAA